MFHGKHFLNPERRPRGTGKLLHRRRRGAAPAGLPPVWHDDIELAHPPQRAGPETAGEGPAGDLPGTGPAARPRAAPDPADAAARRRELLAQPHPPGRPARPALAARSGTPEGWAWQIGAEGRAGSFRTPPAPFRDPAFARGRGACCICGQPVFRFGWHRDLWGRGAPNTNAGWHAACVAAWKFWIAPHAQVRALKLRQRHRCTTTGKRLLRTAEVDHLLPLYRVWREHRDAPWPELLGYWGAPNLRVVNRAAHLDKCRDEAAERSRTVQRARFRVVEDESGFSVVEEE